jgi:uncharacterized LabA/DUF88 family protein
VAGQTGVGVYIDGFNLYHAIDGLKQPSLKWLSLHALALSFLRAGEQLAVVRYFTAIQHSFPEKSKRHRRYIDALISTGVNVHLSKFQKATKLCFRTGNGCPFHEEKQTDVKLCSAALVDAFQGAIGRFVLVTADSDQVPTVETLKGLGAGITVSVAAPPGRLTVARELGQKADEIFELKPGRLTACVLPRNVYEPTTGRFVASCPAEYA